MALQAEVTKMVAAAESRLGLDLTSDQIRSMGALVSADVAELLRELDVDPDTV